MHQNAFFYTKYLKKFSGEGTKRDTPSPDPYSLGASIPRLRRGLGHPPAVFISLPIVLGLDKTLLGHLLVVKLLLKRSRPVVHQQYTVWIA